MSVAAAFCTVFLLTTTCSDDKYVVPPVPNADFYRVAWNGQMVDYDEPVFPFGCWIGTARIVAVNDAGESPDPLFVIWAPPPTGRFAEFSTHPAPLCGGPPSEE